MADTKPLGSLDYFKIIVALLVIAIHTSPLTSFNVEADLRKMYWIAFDWTVRQL